MPINPIDPFHCPGCGQVSATGAVLCVHCGLDFRTGIRLLLKTAPIESSGQAASARNKIRFWECVADVFEKILRAGELLRNALLVILLMMVGGYCLLVYWAKHTANTGEPETAAASATIPQSTAPAASASPSAQAPMPDDQYFDYLKVKFNGERDSSKKTGHMATYLSAYPQGRHMGEAKALLEQAQVEQEEAPRKQAFALVAPLMEKYAQLEAGFDQGINYADFNRSFAGIKAEWNKLDTNDPKLTELISEVKIKTRVEITLTLVGLFWQMQVESTGDYAWFKQNPLASDRVIANWIKLYPDLEGAVFTVPDTHGGTDRRFSTSQASKIMMTMAHRAMEEARLNIKKRFGK